MNLAAISPGVAPFDEVNVVIEVPIGGPPIKYEIDKASGALVVDRFLYTPMHYPGNYGLDRKSTRLNSSHSGESRMPSSA